MIQPVIQMEDLTVRFGRKRVLHGITFTLPPGELMVIVGPSGAGKSTLLRAINRLNEFHGEARTGGRVRVTLEGEAIDIHKDSICLPELRRRVGMVFQTPAILPFSIEKNLSMPLRVTLGIGRGAARRRMEEALRKVSLWQEVKGRLRDDAATLSGGQQQRLCLARTLALEPQILLLDEPTASLDFKATEKIEQLLLALKTDYSIVAVSHSLRQARRLADRLLVLREGRVMREMAGSQLRQAGVFERLIEEAF